MNLTSKSLFVGMYLPHLNHAIPAALMKFERINAIEEGSFAYGKQYLANPHALALHPDTFPLNDAITRLPSRPVREHGALPVVIQDALPDGWGRLLIAHKNGGQIQSDIDLLLQTNDDRVGAMVFSANTSMPPNHLPQTYDLHQLSDAIDKLQYGMELSTEMKRLILLGGTLGGARPKASFVQDHALWMAKFPMIGDLVDMQIMECATMSLAQLCGIRVPKMLLVEAGRHGYALLSKRFDRHGPLSALQRIHYLSLSGLSNVPYESNDSSYVEFAQLLNRLSITPAADMQELFRRMVFNMVVDNSDDHIKNHGVLYAGNGRFQLSPAFDVVPQLQNIGYTSLSIDGFTQTAHLDHARAASAQFGLSLERADVIILQILETVHSKWSELFKSCHADNSMLKQVEACFKRQAANIGAPAQFH